LKFRAITARTIQTGAFGGSGLLWLCGCHRTLVGFRRTAASNACPNSPDKRSQRAARHGRGSGYGKAMHGFERNHCRPFGPAISIILTKSDAGSVAAKSVNFIDRQRLAWGCARPETLVRCSAACNERARRASRSLHRLPPGARSLDHPLAAKTILLLDRTARWRITGLRQAKVLA
jgi:hypothetical protein